jgi:hypothetical protein
MNQQNDNQSYTPYTPPTADTKFEPGMGSETFIPGGRSIPAGNALLWISSAWGLFKQRIGLWIGFAVVWLLTLLMSSRIPVVSGLLVAFVTFMLVAGLIHSSDLLRRKGTFSFGDFFAAFQRKTAPMLIASLMAFAFLFASNAISGLIGGEALVRMLVGGFGPGAAVDIGMRVILGMLIAFAGFIIYSMSIWFAPALIMMHDVAPFEALKMSFFACLKNLLPGVVFFVVMMLVMGISAIPLGLGLLVTLPVFLICYYTSYHDIFLNEEN